MHMTLYFGPSSCALASLITLYEAGQEPEVVCLNLPKGEHLTAEYLAINPKGKVPAFVVDGKVITENTAIMSWIARKFPQAHVLPTGDDESIEAISLMAWCAGGLHPPLTRIVRPTLFCDMPGSEESLRRLATKMVISNFTVVEQLLASHGTGVVPGKDWVFDHWTAVDAYLFWVWRRFGQLGIEIPRFPLYAAHAERMKQRPSVQRAFAEEQRAVAEFATRG